MAFLCETASAWNVDSCRINPAANMGSKSILRRLAAQRNLVGKRIKRFPCRHRNIRNFRESKFGTMMPPVRHACAVVALVERQLARFEQETRRRGCEVSVLQFLFRRSIERNRAKRLCARPTVLRSNWYRLVKRTKRWRRRNFLQNSAGFSSPGPKLGQARCRALPK